MWEFSPFKTLKQNLCGVHSQSHPSRKYLRVLIFVFVLVLFSGNADNQFAKTAKQGHASGESWPICVHFWGKSHIYIWEEENTIPNRYIHISSRQLSIPFFANNLFCPAVIGRPFSLSRSLFSPSTRTHIIWWALSRGAAHRHSLSLSIIILTKADAKNFYFHRASALIKRTPAANVCEHN